MNVETWRAAKAEDRMAAIRSGEVALCHEFDCYYFVATGAWLERKCTDQDCEFCSARPERKA